jgi:hypothetical protein
MAPTNWVPNVVNYIREFNRTAGVPTDRLYDTTLYILAGFLLVDFLCNAYGDARRRAMVHEAGGGRGVTGPAESANGVELGGFDIKVALAWLVVSIPLAYGVWKTFESATLIFG